MKKTIVWNEYEKEIAFLKSEIDNLTLEANEPNTIAFEWEKKRKDDELKALKQDLDFAIQSEELVRNAEFCLQFLQSKGEIFSYIGSIIDRFVSESIDTLSRPSGISHFESCICYSAKISASGMSGITSICRYNKDYGGNFIQGESRYKTFDFLFSAEKSNESTNLLKERLEMLVKLLQESINIDEKFLWLMCHQLVLDSVVNYLSNNWVFTYPDFQNAVSEEGALENYISLGFNQRSAEFFPFICWLAYKLDIAENFFSFKERIENTVPECQRKLEYLKFKARMAQEDTTEKNTNSVTIEIVDQYNGIEFERFVGSLFESDGYRVEYTLSSNDKGIDIIARRNGIGIGIQCKCYSSSVGIAAVQEAFAGKNFYHLDKAMVVTNNCFTTAAKDLAKSTNVILWDRAILVARMGLL